MNIGDTSAVDKIANFCGTAAVPTATSRSPGQTTWCTEVPGHIGDTEYLDTALKHANDTGATGAITIGFLYDTELNFGDDDDPERCAGHAKTGPS